MTRTKKVTTTNKISANNPGKKGGMSVVSPEMIGAMTGAAIGGLTGMMLANKKTREKLAIVKDQALQTAGDMIQNVEIRGREISEDVRDATEEVTDKAIEKTKRSNKS